VKTRALNGIHDFEPRLLNITITSYITLSSITPNIVLFVTIRHSPSIVSQPLAEGATPETLSSRRCLYPHGDTGKGGEGGKTEAEYIPSRRCDNLVLPPSPSPDGISRLMWLGAEANYSFYLQILLEARASVYTKILWGSGKRNMRQHQLRNYACNLGW
jgi:hypothetical protein